MKEEWRDTPIVEWKMDDPQEIFVKIGFKDKNGNDLRVGQEVKTYDSKGNEWIGKIVPASRVVRSSIIDAGGVQYAFKSNYETWINDQAYASELEIMGGQ